MSQIPFPTLAVEHLASKNCNCQHSSPDVMHNVHWPSCMVGRAQAYLDIEVTWKINGEPVDAPPLYRPEPLNHQECLTLERIADLLDRESRTWCDGWQVKIGDEWGWPDPPQDEMQKDVEARVLRLDNAARFCRQMANKLRRKTTL